jgi:hypothetical protein
MSKLRGIFGVIVKFVIGPRRRGEEFVCGDCEEWQRCGLPPNENCVVRAAQIARLGEKPLRRTAVIGSDAGWIHR